ncbi:MAG: family 16 glycosylhydrolase [Flavobacteriales bacterium]
MKFSCFFNLSILLFFVGAASNCNAQTVQDDFEGNGTITTWYGDNCGINTSFSNPAQQVINTSPTVLRYHDTGGQYANVRFQSSVNFDLTLKNTFSLRIYVPSAGITGNAPQQISLKLQDGTLNQPWVTQSEIIKPILLNQWQELTFNFDEDVFINLEPNSPDPSERSDFNRVVIQVNGENNYDHVLAYIDDISYYETTDEDPVFDNLVWSDEFEGTGVINTDNWFQQTQLPAGGSWFNGEIQHYTDRPENSYVNGGNLYLTARDETYTNQGVTKEYTSARLNSKFAFTYGRVEVRAKLPVGVGTWPAIWMLGQNISESGAYWQTQGFGTTSWPACGEIDIMEHWGNNQNYVQSAMHTPSSFGATINHGGQVVNTASTEFHVYTMEWNQESITFSVDGNVHYIYNPEVKNAETWPFDSPQYIIMNIAIQPSIAASFVQDAMEVDYVRVYQEGAETSFCPADLDNSGDIGISDLSFFLVDYGCVGSNCAGDLNNDGSTNIGDISEFLAAFGTDCN